MLQETISPLAWRCVCSADVGVTRGSTYQSRNSEVPSVHLLRQPVHFSPGVEEYDSLGDCQSLVQITQGVQLPLLEQSTGQTTVGTVSKPR